MKLLRELQKELETANRQALLLIEIIKVMCELPPEQSPNKQFMSRLHVWDTSRFVPLGSDLVGNAVLSLKILEEVYSLLEEIFVWAEPTKNLLGDDLQARLWDECA